MRSAAWCSRYLCTVQCTVYSTVYSTVVLPVPVVVVDGGEGGDHHGHRVSGPRLQRHHARAAPQEVLVVPEEVAVVGEGEKLHVLDRVLGDDGEARAELRSGHTVTLLVSQVSDVRYFVSWTILSFLCAFKRA